MNFNIDTGENEYFSAVTFKKDGRIHDFRITANLKEDSYSAYSRE